MSGITPILDTLLHQVLGKRVDVPVARQTPEPVRPLSPAEAPPAVRSDSRLDPRSAPLPALPTTGHRERALPAATAPADQGAAPSTRTHFSAAARTIADILTRYPAPPSAVRPAAPLMAAADNEASPLANRLQTSFSQSGLFYESHLHNWYRGEVSGARLALEPQMRLSRPADPASAARGEAKGPLPGGGAAAAVPSRSTPPAAMERAVPGAPVDARMAADSEHNPRPAPTLPPLSEEANHALQGILRHQLETLATPVLRWEGDVWSGIFMALMIQVPAEAPRQPHSDHRHAGDGGDDAEEDEEGTWRSDLTLNLPALGSVQVRLNLRGDHLEIDLNTDSESTASRLRAGGERLRSRLNTHGFEQVLLRVGADERL